jgi:hypothetical protein
VDIAHIETNKLYELEVEANAMPPEGVEEVKYLLAHYGWGGLEFPKYWPWDWVVEKGDYTGTLPKRISKYIHRNHERTMDEALAQKIGEVAKKHVGNFYGKVEMDFDTSLNWNAGDFGDPGSCFWQSRKDCIRVLKKRGAWAVRFYREGKGVGRAWCIKHNGGLIVFNGYGLSTAEIARILSKFLGLPHRQINLYFNGSYERVVYVNGGKAFYLDAASVLKANQVIDLPWQLVAECYNCHVEDSVARSISRRSYCEKCYSLLYFTCARCQNTRSTLQMHKNNLCGSCSSNICSKCESHEKTILIRLGEEGICRECIETLKEEAYARLKLRTPA